MAAELVACPCAQDTPGLGIGEVSGNTFQNLPGGWLCCFVFLFTWCRGLLQLSQRKLWWCQHFFVVPGPLQDSSLCVSERAAKPSAAAYKSHLEPASCPSPSKGHLTMKGFGPPVVCALGLPFSIPCSPLRHGLEHVPWRFLRTAMPNECIGERAKDMFQALAYITDVGVAARGGPDPEK